MKLEISKILNFLVVILCYLPLLEEVGIYVPVCIQHAITLSAKMGYI